MHDLAWRTARRLTAIWGRPLERPESSVGTMVTVPLPPEAGSTADDAYRLRNALLYEDQIEVQLHAGHGRLWVRISAQIYNDDADVDRLVEAIDRRNGKLKAENSKLKT